jgi:SAM-dependent methyltransferase
VKASGVQTKPKDMLSIIRGTAGSKSEQRIAFYFSQVQDILGGVNSFLDIGCSNDVARFLIGRGANQIVGININKVDGFQGDLIVHDANQPYPILDESFDCALMFSVLEHLSDKPNVMRETFRVLRPGGTFIVQIPNPYFPVDLHFGIPFFQYIPFDRLRLMYYGFVDHANYIAYLNSRSTHGLYYVSAKNVGKLARRHGFAIIRIVESNPLFLVPERLGGVASILSALGFFRLFPLGFIICLRKPIKDPLLR